MKSSLRSIGVSVLTLLLAVILTACDAGSAGTGGGSSGSSDLQIGEWSWSLPRSGSGTATATGTIYNYSSGGESGSIGLRLRLSTAPYGDGGTYYETARTDGLFQLSGGYHRDYTVSDPFSLSSVPSGTYYVVLILAEYTGGTGSGYTIRDGASSSTTYTIGGGDGNGDTADTCASGQLSCFMNNLSIHDEDGNEIELLWIQGPLPDSITESGTSPEITTTPTSVTVDGTDSHQLQNIGWTDPQGCQPAFCIRFCSHGVCTTRFGCTPSIPDDLVSGVWRTSLGYRAEPAGAVGTTEEFFFEVTPISMPNCQDPIQFFQDKQNAGEGISDLGPDQNVYTGVPVTIPHAVVNSAGEGGDDREDGDGGTGGDGGGSGGGAEGTSCTSSSQCSGNCFSNRNCVDGFSCSCSGTASPGTCLNVSSCSGSGGPCGDGVNACCVGLSCVNGSCKSSGSCL